ncbi:peptidase S51 dipeptidase E [Ornithinibacillus sp. L9]|uniref:Peptidase S51 dipeptidase E n=1 Tax=Ornithinibacillus caprae TaxID=2678566 RepID=A0A6N8FLL8_9BACI|nr:Type 1 glutamine amidotransferase-like domain-containing protein [Ornithinibacillus caprae]MUK90540.1 peptidase S51 dipeptidase E [Ornithinibacillus caprae]
MVKHLFLFGGVPPFTCRMAKEFAKLVERSKNPSVTILTVEREGWEDYIPNYTQLLKKEGIHRFHLCPLPSTPIVEVMDHVRSSSGIIIGGGNTNRYADYIVDTPIAKVIVERHEQGIPVAGFSAGALISPNQCVISAKDNDSKVYQEREGLGLLSNVLIAVHFSQWHEEQHLRDAVQQHRRFRNYGIDEHTCAYFVNEELRGVEGEGVYTIQGQQLNRLN